MRKFNGKTVAEIKRWRGTAGFRFRNNLLSAACLRALKKHLDGLPDWSSKRIKRNSLVEWVEIASRLANKYGAIPTGNWMNTNGYSGLAWNIRKHPEFFKHLPKTKKHKCVREWVCIAEKLARSNKGVLPSSTELLDMGYGRLNEIKRIHPRHFRHIKAKKLIKNCEEWVQIAEHLARRNNGKLPSASWLQHNGYLGLYASTRKYPKLFAHIKRQQQNFVSKSKWVEIAELLAKENNGVLPHPKALRDTGYSKLQTAIYEKPALFSHLRQNKTKRDSDNWVLIAEELCRKNKDRLPSVVNLRRTGYESLVSYMYAHPSYFRHIKQEVSTRQSWVFKTKNEHLKDAEYLSNKYGGLPNSSWLNTHGYAGLLNLKRKCPTLFLGFTEKRLPLNNHD